ncbi:MAG: guanylate kinase [Bacteroidota bacterium]|nr:guanylate kinase [Bacteroidota bacterium]
MSNPKLIVVSAPSGCGKTTIVKEILKSHPEFHFSVSATTRAKRNNETDGKDYYFITKEEFQKHIENDTLIEWQKIYDDYYGTLVSEVDKSFACGKSVVFDIDVLGALSIKKKYPEDSMLIFIDVPDMDILNERLKNRKTESPETLKKRIDRVEMEMKQKTLFDYIVINDQLQQAVDEVEKIISNNFN